MISPPVESILISRKDAVIIRDAIFHYEKKMRFGKLSPMNRLYCKHFAAELNEIIQRLKKQEE